jgi:hypothetical protein
MGTGSERDTDMIREVLFDTNPVLLGITFVVSMFHMLFDFLAFKNDIQVMLLFCFSVDKWSRFW